ncbi:MAG: aminopeptidase N [Gammaproteobacteria bacterium]|nr:aminopeptidase N [Gammaproteobacteria bacterium]
MKDSTPKAIHLKDYTQPYFWIDTVDLVFELGEAHTRVWSTMTLRKNQGFPGHYPLTLNGEHMQLEAVKLDGAVLGHADYEVTEDELIIHHVPDSFTLEIETLIKPQENTALEGLYKSGGNFCTQCEAEGFRRITYYLDRPDVMATFTTTVIADKQRYPVLLSNGNPVGQGEHDDGRHWVRWQDPFKKPCYLFALVAGDLGFIEDRFTTLSGREIMLRIYVERHNIDQCDHAMASLKKAMQWDEQVYGREYDLDVYNIVAVDDFNMGAMENKGLNVFNSKCVLAKQETATDNDFINIEGVIAHEYFHNWSGNRVTCRDWFQLTLKEGLTVFRDEQFTADMNAATPKRIDDVNILRTSQFAEDGGPMSHPIQPASYMEINNFYTVTVYNKGAEVIRMIHTLTGVDGFRRGMDLYFERNDGKAVTTEEFLQAMEEANAIELKQFRNWYHQAGTPVLTVTEDYDAATQTYSLTLQQHTPATPGQEHKQPFHIPVCIGLMGPDGDDMQVQLADDDSRTAHVLNVTEDSQTFVFNQVAHKPVASLLRGYSAPVKLEFDRSDEELAFCMAHDTDEFNRWDAGQQLASRIILCMVEMVQNDVALEMPDNFVDAYARTLADHSLERSLLARALALPSISYISERMPVADVHAIHAARKFMQRQLSQRLQQQWLDVYHDNQTTHFSLSPEAMGRRFLKNVALSYLFYADAEAYVEVALDQYEKADNMTDQLAAFRVLVHNDTSQRQHVTEAFYQQWQQEHLVIDKWFSIQAMAVRDDTIDSIKELFRHPDFDLKNPNRVRALLGTFCSANPVCFHDTSGDGYHLLGEYVERLNALNPQIAARLLSPLTRWRRFDASAQTLMKTELERLSVLPHLSRDVYELVSKSLK